MPDPIEFTVEEDDTKNEVVMRDVMTKSKKAAIKITKELKLNDELMTAVDKTFYVALFADQECTKMVSEIKALEFKDASSATVEFKGLDLGRTYYVKEVDKDGQVIEVGTTEDGTAFVPFFPEGNEATITEDGEKTYAYLRKPVYRLAGWILPRGEAYHYQAASEGKR